MRNSWDTYTIASIWHKNEHEYFPTDVDTICSKMWIVLQEQSSRKNVSLKEQIMSEDKYVFVQNIVFIVLQIFWNVQKKCLQTAYYFLLGMFSFEYSLVWLNKKNKYFPSSSSIITIWQRLIVVDRNIAGDILGYSPVLAKGYSVTWWLRPIACK